MATYRLSVSNYSSSFEQFAVYQNDPDLGVPNAMSLAWFVQGANPGQTLYFEWSIDYSVMWSASGLTGGAVKFRIAQEVPVDPQDVNRNGVELIQANGVPMLQPAPLSVGTPRTGSIYVNEMSNLPDAAGMVGLAIGGRPAYAAPAAPNRLEVFSPTPNYWITAGTFEEGVALDVEEITARSQQVVFDNGIYDLSVNFDRSREWTVSETV